MALDLGPSPITESSEPLSLDSVIEMSKISEKPRLALDLETYLIGPEAVIPRPVCLTVSTHKIYEPGRFLEAAQVSNRLRDPKEASAALVSNGDAHWLATIEWILSWLEADERHEVVCHNGHAFDWPVIAIHFPHLITRIFNAFERGQIRDTITREKLLNLALSGVVDHYFTPDGERKNISYRLSSLTARYLGVDRLAVKGQDADGNLIKEDVWRLHYDTLDGTPSTRFPPEAASYALEDARDTIAISIGQDLRAYDKFTRQGGKFPDGTPFDVFRTEPLHVGAMFCLTLGTYEGFGVDAAVVDHMDREVTKALRPEQTYLLYESKLLTRPLPRRPYAKNVKHKGGECSCAADTHEPGTPKMVPPEPAHRKNKVLLELVVKTWAANRFCDDDKCPKYNQECDKHGLPPLKMTEPSKKFPQGQISCDGEVIADLAPYNNLASVADGQRGVLAQYDHYTIVGKLQTLEIPRLREAIKYGSTIHPGFDEMKKTGRVSSRGTKLYPSVNIQQIPRRVVVDELGPDFKPIFDAVVDKSGQTKLVKRTIKIEPRNAYVPRQKGWVLVSIDYSFVELVTLAQQLKRAIGYSVLGEKIAKGFDPHAYLGAMLARGLDTDFADACRAWAPDDDSTYTFFVSLKGKTNEEKAFYKHWRTLAKSVGLGYPGGLGPRTFIVYAKKLYGITIKSIEQAKQFREVWLSAFPECREYLSHYVRDNFRDEVHSDSSKERFAYWSPLGAYRSRCSFTEVANGYALQTPAAEAMKIATFKMQRACWDPSLGSSLYGCRMLAAIHDESIIAMPNDRWLHERAFEATKLWLYGMDMICPDVPCKAEPAAMECWEKDAEMVLGPDDRLRVWSPKVSYKADSLGRLRSAT